MTLAVAYRWRWPRAVARAFTKIIIVSWWRTLCFTVWTTALRFLLITRRFSLIISIYGQQCTRVTRRASVFRPRCFVLLSQHYMYALRFTYFNLQ